MNWFLIIVMAVTLGLVIMGSVYVLVYFQHEEDKNTAYAPKIVVVTGLTLACVVVLMLPLDVANSHHQGGLQGIDTLWQIIYITIAIMCIVIIPFALFYYEAEDPDSQDSQFWTAVKYEAVTVFVATLTLVLMWILIGKAYIPYEEYESKGLLEMAAAVGSCSLQAGKQCTAENKKLEIWVTPPVYVMALISFLGWFFFALFGGIGLASLPMDLIQDYINRPHPIDLQEFAKRKMTLNERARKLIDIGKRFEAEGKSARKNRANKRMYNKFKQAVFFLEKDWENLKVSYKLRGGNPLWYLLYLFMGIVSAIISLLWIIHIILFVFIQPPASPFLNEYFLLLDKAFGLFGVITYGIFSFYLLWCVVKGNIKFGLRFFFFTIHPMKIGATMMNSLLFNTSLILLCSVSVVQFCSTAFSLYTHLTQIDMLFGVQVKNLVFLEYFYRNNVFLFILISMAGLSFLYLICFPKEKPQENLEPMDD